MVGHSERNERLCREYPLFVVVVHAERESEGEQEKRPYHFTRRKAETGTHFL